MRIRTIKPEFWTHPVITRLDAPTKLLAIALLNYADDEGWFYADPDLIRGAVAPRDDSTNIRRSIEQLSKIAYVNLFEHETHGLIGRIVNFCEHQRVDRPKPSRIKGLSQSSNIRRIIDEGSTLEGKGREGKGKEYCPELERPAPGKPPKSPPDQVSDAQPQEEQPPDPPPAPSPTPEPDPPPEPELALPPAPVILEIPVLPSGSVLEITQRDVYGFEQYFPGIDVLQSLRSAAAWLQANPKRRKTKRGITSFLTSWLSRDQDDPRKHKLRQDDDNKLRNGTYDQAF